MNAWRLWRAQPAWRRRLAVEAALALARAKLVLAARPFSVAVASASGPLGPRSAGPEIAELAAVVDAVGKRLWWRSVCFDRGLALQAMCRRRGIDARLHYGIGKDEADALAAHVWVSVDGVTVLGGAEAPAFRCVATYPGGDAR